MPNMYIWSTAVLSNFYSISKTQSYLLDMGRANLKKYANQWNTVLLLSWIPTSWSEGEVPG